MDNARKMMPDATIPQTDHPRLPPLNGTPVPLMSRDAWAKAIDIPLGVLVAQCSRGYWPQITIGKRVFINVEAVRLRAAERAREVS